MTREQLRAKILETIKGYEPVAKGDGTPIGYDLDKDGRTEFGFYWEFEDMEDCADAIMALLDEVEREEHIFTPVPGGTVSKCTCGKVYATTSEAQQHRQWELDKQLNSKEK